MIYVQKPDGTVLTWEQKVDMFIRADAHKIWDNISATQIFGLLIPHGVTVHAKRNYYWDWAGDILREYNGSEYEYAEKFYTEKS